DAMSTAQVHERLGRLNRILGKRFSMMLSGGNPRTIIQRVKLYAEFVEGSVGTFSGRGTWLEAFRIDFEKLVAESEGDRALAKKKALEIIAHNLGREGVVYQNYQGLQEAMGRKRFWEVMGYDSFAPASVQSHRPYDGPALSEGDEQLGVPLGARGAVESPAAAVLGFIREKTAGWEERLRPVSAIEVDAYTLQVQSRGGMPIRLDFKRGVDLETLAFWLDGHSDTQPLVAELRSVIANAEKKIKAIEEYRRAGFKAVTDLTPIQTGDFLVSDSGEPFEVWSASILDTPPTQYSLKSLAAVGVVRTVARKEVVNKGYYHKPRPSNAWLVLESPGFHRLRAVIDIIQDVAVLQALKTSMRYSLMPVSLRVEVDSAVYAALGVDASFDHANKFLGDIEYLTSPWLGRKILAIQIDRRLERLGARAAKVEAINQTLVYSGMTYTLEGDPENKRQSFQDLVSRLAGAGFIPPNLKFEFKYQFDFVKKKSTSVLSGKLVVTDRDARKPDRTFSDLRQADQVKEFGIFLNTFIPAGTEALAESQAAPTRSVAGGGGTTFVVKPAADAVGLKIAEGDIFDSVSGKVRQVTGVNEPSREVTFKVTRDGQALEDETHDFGFVITQLDEEAWTRRGARAAYIQADQRLRDRLGRNEATKSARDLVDRVLLDLHKKFGVLSFELLNQANSARNEVGLLDQMSGWPVEDINPMVNQIDFGQDPQAPRARSSLRELARVLLASREVRDAYESFKQYILTAKVIPTAEQDSVVLVQRPPTAAIPTASQPPAGARIVKKTPGMSREARTSFNQFKKLQILLENGISDPSAWLLKYSAETLKSRIALIWETNSAPAPTADEFRKMVEAREGELEKPVSAEPKTSQPAIKPEKSPEPKVTAQVKPDETPQPAGDVPSVKDAQKNFKQVSKELETSRKGKGLDFERGPEADKAVSDLVKAIRQAETENPGAAESAKAGLRKTALDVKTTKIFGAPTYVEAVLALEVLEGLDDAGVIREALKRLKTGFRIKSNVVYGNKAEHAFLRLRLLGSIHRFVTRGGFKDNGNPGFAAVDLAELVGGLVYPGDAAYLSPAESDEARKLVRGIFSSIPSGDMWVGLGRLQDGSIGDPNAVNARSAIPMAVEVDRKRNGGVIILPSPAAPRPDFNILASIEGGRFAKAFYLALLSVVLLFTGAQKSQAQTNALPESQALNLKFLTNYADSVTGLTPSYVVPSYWWPGSQDPFPVSEYVKRVILNYGVNFYDNANVQVVYALSGLTNRADQTTTLLSGGYLGQFNDIRAHNAPFTYGDAKVTLPRTNSYTFNMLPANGVYSPLQDPFTGETSVLGYPEFNTIHWLDYKPRTGENVWANILGPLQTAYLKNNGVISLDSPEAKLAFSILPALEALKSPVGAIYSAPHGTFELPGNVISNETQASVLAALDALLYVLEQNKDSHPAQYSDLVLRVNSLKTFILFYLGAYAFNTATGVLNQGGQVDTNGMFTADTNFAVDASTWPLLVLNRSTGDIRTVDQFFGGEGAAYRIWQAVKQRAGFYDTNGVLRGVSFSAGHDNYFTEQTAVAVLMARELAKEYRRTGRADYAAALEKDAITMREGMDRLSYANLDDGTVSYNYAYFDGQTPNGPAYALSHTVATAWKFYTDYRFPYLEGNPYDFSGFNPFVLGGRPQSVTPTLPTATLPVMAQTFEKMIPEFTKRGYAAEYSRDAG
ncbi:MAG: hypothetical protein HYZ87_00915, partial [Candidatus Omnitrophica bacterium]|nr:hypothetical protein [Candidatus Omnitrophota bacterium]